MLNVPVRFFSYCMNDEFEVDICEVSEATFKLLKGAISYERHAIFNNGVDQICLTIEPEGYPDIKEVKL